jgi:N4-gp56 family major capsid protein
MAGQLWSVSVLGGFMYSDELSDKLRLEVIPVVKFRQFCDAQDGTQKQLNKGDAFYWNTYSKVASGGGTLLETEVMPETNFTVKQQSLTVTEYGNSIPYSGKLNNLSKHPVQEIIKKVLKRDCVETLDGAAHAQFNATSIALQPASGTSTTAITLTEGDATVTNNVALGKDHIKVISDAIKERNVPPFMNDHYYCIGWPSTFRTFKNDLEAVAQHTETGFSHIMNGEIGLYEGVVFCEQTHVAKGGAVDSTTWTYRVADAWDNAASDWAFFFGEDTVAEGIVIPEEIRGKIPSDYGRSRGVAWYYLGGFGLVHPLSGTDYTDIRIFKWDSAA